ncbi:MAG: condensation domain-containing protein, partial [Myxococcota bacterium]
MQQGILFHSLYAPDKGEYTEQVYWTWRRGLDLDLLRRAFAQMIQRHSLLRTSFFWEGMNEPVQTVRKQVTMPWRDLDWTALTAQQQDQRWRELRSSDQQQGFELTAAPLLRMTTVRTGPDVYQLLLTYHHILLDGWSIPLLLRDVLQVYRGLSRGEEPQLPKVRPFRDYIAWLGQQNRSQAERYWKDSLRGIESPTSLGVTTGGDSTHVYRQIRTQWSRALTERAQATARSCQVTMNTLFQGLWGLLLSVYSGDRDVVFGTVCSGRIPAITGVETMLGLFINTMPVRVRIQPELTLAQWLGQLQRSLYSARKYEYCALSEIQRWSDVPRGTSLFHSISIVENLPNMEEESMYGDVINVDGFHHSASATGFPVTVGFFPNQQIELQLTYDEGNLTEAVGQRIFEHLQWLIEDIVTRPDAAIGDLRWVTPDNEQRLVATYNQTASPYPQSCIHEQFAAQVRQRPDAIAVVCGARSHTYAELDERSDRLASVLRTHGIGLEQRVGLCVERSVEMIVGMLGILKAGAAYTPLDPSYPAERLSFMIDDADLAAIITEHQYRTLFAERITTLCG